MRTRSARSFPTGASFSGSTYRTAWPRATSSSPRSRDDATTGRRATPRRSRWPTGSAPSRSSTSGPGRASAPLASPSPRTASTSTSRPRASSSGSTTRRPRDPSRSAARPTVGGASPSPTTKTSRSGTSSTPTSPERPSAPRPPRSCTTATASVGPSGSLTGPTTGTLALGLLGRLLKLDRDAARALDVSKAVYKRYVESYPGFVISNDRQRDQEAARFHRVAEFVEVVARDERLLDEAARALLNHPRVAAALEEPRRAAVERAYAEAQSAAEKGRRGGQVRGRGRPSRTGRPRQAPRPAPRGDRRGPTRGGRRPPVGRRRSRRRRARPRRPPGQPRGQARRVVRPRRRPPRPRADGDVCTTRPRRPPVETGRRVPPMTPDPRTPAPGPAPETAPTPKAAASGLARRLSSTGDVFLGPTVVSAFLTGRAVVVAGDAAAEVLRATADVLAGGADDVGPRLARAHGAQRPPRPLRAGRPTGSSPTPAASSPRLDGPSDELHLVVLEGYDRAARRALPHLARRGLRRRRPDAVPPAPSRSRGPGARRVRSRGPPNVLLACVPRRGGRGHPPRSGFLAPTPRSSTPATRSPGGLSDGPPSQVPSRGLGGGARGHHRGGDPVRRAGHLPPGLGARTAPLRRWPSASACPRLPPAEPRSRGRLASRAITRLRTRPTPSAAPWGPTRRP